MMMYKDLDKEDLIDRLIARDKEVLFLKEELLKSAHQMERIAERMENQNLLSSKLLKALSPDKIPSIPGFKISSKFVASIKGSEYLEILNYREKKHFGLIMSHMEGSGLSALFLASLLKHSPEIQSSRSQEPVQMLETLASEIQAHLEEAHSVSLLYGVVDPSTNEILYSSFGAFGIFSRKTNGEIQIESPLHDSITKTTANYKNQDKLPLELGQSLIFVSPGYLKGFANFEPTAAMNLVKDHLEEQEWSDKNQVRNSLFVLQNKHLGGSKTSFDASVVVIENNDRSLKLTSLE